MPITQFAERYLAVFSAGGREFPVGISYLEKAAQYQFSDSVERLVALR